MTPEETLVSYHKEILEKWVNRGPLILQEMLDFFHPDFSGFGTGLHENLENLEAYAQLIKNEHEEVPEPSILELAWLKGKTINNTGNTWCIFHFKIPVEGQFFEMKNLRMSLTWVKEKGKDWKAIHGHASAPWVMQQEGETWPIEELQARNQELEKIVAEKTADLIEKNRVLKVEMALERVRSASMAMRKSEELTKVATIMYEELQKLGLTQSASAGFGLIDEEKEMQYMWASQSNDLLDFFTMPLLGDQVLQDRYDAWKRGDSLFEQVLNGQELRKHLEVVLPVAETSREEEAAKNNMPDPSYFYFANFKQGYLQILSGKSMEAEYQSILQRFAKLFEQTYTRFLDLQKAEAQARKAQIEASLERVRSRALAMRQSDELSECADLLYAEFYKLGVESFSCGYLINDDKKQVWKIWLTNPGEKFFKEFWTAPFYGDQVLTERYESWKREEKFHCAVLEGDINRKHNEYITTLAPWKEAMLDNLPQRLVFNSAHFSVGHLLVISPDRLNVDIEHAMERFAGVFDFAYQRFLDLQQTERQAKELEIIFEENQRLLHSILPVGVVKELLETGSVKPARFDEVSILFSDFKEFTNIVATIPTRKLISELNELFSEFDDIMEAEGIEKIQTVGDAYLAASGLPEEVPDHALRCIRAAKKMIDFLNRRNETSAIKWKIRIGIHSGPIAAGVVGKKKFAYDIFGDTINTASRIETAGEEGKINVSAYTYDLIKDQFPCEYRGKISAKGKGDLDMYFVK
jgi:class 3 adenylate cyclase